MSSYEIRVYKIYFDDCDDIYIGSTKTTLSRRMAQHRVAVRRGSTYRVHNFIRSKNMDFNYILVRSCFVFNKDQQRLFEQTVISEMNPNLNQRRAHTTEEQARERNKEYNQNNKESIKEYKKEYDNNNKEKQKEYYNKNKEQIKEKHKEYQKENKEQIKEYRKNNKESIKKSQKEYQKENKESISEKSKVYRDKNKEQLKIKIHCPYCDKHTRRSDIARHNKTKNHIKNLYLFYHNFIHS